MYTIKDMLYGIAIADAIGVPYEFLKRDSFKCNDMIGYGSHDQPAGTWSDDTSLTLCLAAAMNINDINYNKIANNMISWLKHRKFLAGIALFDVGNTTRQAINNMYSGIDPIECGPSGITNNGNGSLMRIAPSVYYLMNEKDIDERYKIIKNLSSMTHGHDISVIGCQIFIEYLIELYLTKDKIKAYERMKKIINNFYILHPNEFIKEYDRILTNDITTYEYNEISGAGYVVNTLEAALYCFLTTDTYQDAVLKGVNLGLDTDTTAAVIGALAGPYYGIDSIPIQWIEKLKNKELIDEVSYKFFFH